MPRGFYANFRCQPFACILCMPLPYSHLTELSLSFFFERVLSLVQLANNSILFDLISFFLSRLWERGESETFCFNSAKSIRPTVQTFVYTFTDWIGSGERSGVAGTNGPFQLAATTKLPLATFCLINIKLCCTRGAPRRVPSFEPYLLQPPKSVKTKANCH